MEQQRQKLERLLNTPVQIYRQDANGTTCYQVDKAANLEMLLGIYFNKSESNGSVFFELHRHSISKL